MIELRTINENNYTDCLNLKASVANENFVDSVAYSLAEAWVHYKDTKPFVIYADETMICLLYTSDAADDLLCVDLGGRRIINKKKKKKTIF